MTKEKRKLTNRQLIIKWTCLGMVFAFLLYFIICGIVMGVQLGGMNSQNAVAQNTEHGKNRLQTLKDNGVVTDYKVYGQEEIAADGTKKDVNLYYFPCDKTGKSKFVIICPGGSYASVASESEGYPTAAELNELGYTAFVLEYRTGNNGGNYAAIDDLAATVKFIFNNADEFRVETEEYALCGFSAGGNLVGLFGTESLGYAKYAGVQKPSLIMMGYPWCNLNNKSGNLAKVIMYSVLNSMGYKGLLGKSPTAEQKRSMRVPLNITSDYPDVYIMHGTADVLVPISTHSDVLVAALKENNVNYRYERADGVNHGCGVGKGTSAENWLSHAVEFWEQN